MIRSVVLSSLIPLLLVSPLAAQAPLRLPVPLPLPVNTRGTVDDQKACQNDAVKLCRNALGDDMAVLRCFQSKRERLSVACRGVLTKYGQ